MKLEETIANDALLKINQKCAPFKCPMCKSIERFEFAPIETQYLSLERNGLDLSLGQIQFIPSITGSCPNCGFMASFNLKSLGIL